MKLYSCISTVGFLGTGFIAIDQVQAIEVDPKIHKLCIEAKDYAGCVRAMNGDATMTTIREIRSQGADMAEGNQCPSGFAYVGGGNYSTWIAFFN